ncbi:MAG: hypothetical protein HUU01_06255 [Saprospiraceae bacterium]|nr:hypothetical protein [Saprospiraceae bacterium]
MEWQEGNLVFVFDERSWKQTVKYDETEDYKKIALTPNTKGVDFLGISGDQALWFVEVKDYKTYRIESKEKIPALDEVVHHKVKDTVAGIIGGARNSTNLLETWTAFAQVLNTPKQKVRIVLWMEEDEGPDYMAKRRSVARNTLTSNIERKLKWLTPSILVCNMKRNPIPGLSVRRSPS